MSLLVAVVVWAICEAGWALVPPLRPQRWQLRLHLLMFLLVVTCIYSASVWRVIPDRFQYGNGVLRYASDSLTYQDQATDVAAGLRAGSTLELRDWQKFGYSKLLGLLFAVVGPNNLAAMILNGVFYSATLACVFLIGKEMFGQRVGAIAMAIASVWPGFVLHEVQTIRWVGTTLGLELTVLGCILVVGQRAGVWGLLTGLAGYALLLSDLPYMAKIFAVFVTLFGVALIGAAWRNRQLVRPVVLTLVLGICMIGTFRAVYSFAIDTSSSVATEIRTDTLTVQPQHRRDLLQWLVDIIGNNITMVVNAREAFLIANNQLRPGTAIAGKQLDTSTELLWNVPQAIALAVFAPFPGTLLNGSPGVSNLRPLLLVELLPYLLILAGACVAMVTTLRGTSGEGTRRQAVFITLFVLVAYALLGTIVMNAGTLYRFRQPYVLLQIVLAVEGWRRLAGWYRPSAW